jgi:hypothetical protein
VQVFVKTDWSNTEMMVAPNTTEGQLLAACAKTDGPAAEANFAKNRQCFGLSVHGRWMGPIATVADMCPSGGGCFVVRTLQRGGAGGLCSEAAVSGEKMPQTSDAGAAGHIKQPMHTDPQHQHTPTRTESVDQLVRRLSATPVETLKAEADRPALMDFAKRLGLTGYGKMTNDALAKAVCDAAKAALQRKSQFFSPPVGNAGVDSAKRKSEHLPGPTVTAKQPRNAEVSERGCS